METILFSTLELWKMLSLWVMGFAVFFGILTHICSCNPEQPLKREGMLTDLLYCFIMPVLGNFVRVGFISIGIFLLFFGESPASIEDYLTHGYGPLASMPVWAQAAIIFIVSDFLLYWIHRFFHGKSLWPFHAIHHSSPHVDWLSTYRFHPVNIWLSFTLVDSLVMLVGFSPTATVLMTSFNMIYSAMVHANLNWTFGPFKYLFTSPVFHRWHHTSQAEGMDKNFAPTFPLLDIIFGTFYMPNDRRPERYGVPGSTIPASFWGQLIWPFKQGKK
jgi:sterol desaturase/sphingolipid hydroxylase (fatty acid hydroxylase superfamily)